MAKSTQSHLHPQQIAVPQITLGVVVDTNDPQQMGRLRVVCPALNDRHDAEVSTIPWASYVSPFGGEVNVGRRGPDEQSITGPSAYGMWAIPKVGAQVLVMCLDGRTDNRVWVGCLFGQLLPHTMPHGRFSFEAEGESAPAGPIDSYEKNIEPLASNMTEAFPSPGADNYEWQTRVADFQATGVTQDQIESTFSQISDDEDVPITTPNSKLKEHRQGYDLSRIDPNLQTDDNLTPSNLDNMVTSIVSPGFHAISMDDRVENERMRFRTTAGHQIIMDDTNERVYISTAKGNNWIEIDQAGNIDVYTSGKLSVNADKDINFTTKGSFRVNAERGIHLKSGKEVRVRAEEDINIDTQANIRAKAKQNILMETSTNDISLTSAGQLTAKSGNSTSLTSGGSLLASSSDVTSFDAGGAFVVGGQTIDLGAGGNITVKGSRIDLNGPGAASPTAPTAPTAADTQLAFFPNRTPQHEPWARTGSNDTTGNPLITEYTSPQIGTEDNATGDDGTSVLFTITRGDFWRR